MKVVMLAAGAAGMVCGSCLRDNRLAATLLARKRNVLLVPLYTPLRTDETDVSAGAVYLGGVSVYLRHKLPFLQRMPRVMWRLLNSRLLLAGLSRFSSATRAEELGALTVSVLEGARGAQREEILRLIEALRPQRPDIIHLPNLMLLGVAPALREALGASMVCTLGGEDIFLDDLPDPYRGRAFKLIGEHASHVDAFLPVTRYYAAHAARHFALPVDRLWTVAPGVDAHRFPPADPPPEPLTIGFLARQCPAKGLHVLVEAFVRLRQEGVPVRLRIAGYLSPADRAYVTAQRSRLLAAGLAAAVDFVGEVDFEGKVAFLRSLHIFSAPAVYPESKGLSIVEAMACGVPVVQPAHGSFVELVGETQSGLLFPPGDVPALTAALRTLAGSEALRRELGLAGRRAVEAGFTSEHMTDQTWGVYERIRAGAGGA